MILHNLAPGTAAPAPLLSHSSEARIFGGAMFPAMYNRPMHEQSVTLQTDLGTLSFEVLKQVNLINIRGGGLDYLRPQSIPYFFFFYIARTH